MDMPAIYARFMEKVEKTDSCWNWKGSRRSNGEGFFYFQDYQMKAHRVSWMMSTGVSPRYRLIKQTCGNRGCVNPDHLTVQETERQSSPYDG